MRQEFWTHKIKVARSLGLAIAALTLSCQAAPVSVGYDLRVPEGTPPEKGWPVIVAVHGLRGNGPDTCDTWADIAAREGYLLACPSFNDEARYWEFDHGEVEAIDQMLTEVAATHPLDLPIYLTGISAGDGSPIAIPLIIPSGYGPPLWWPMPAIKTTNPPL
jgi:poly(3-hydroxybutyrate) depolymerase